MDTRTNVEKIRDIAHCAILDFFDKSCDDYVYFSTACGGVEFEFTLLERDEDRGQWEASLYHLFQGICKGYNFATGSDVYIQETWDEEDPNKYYIDINED